MTDERPKKSWREIDRARESGQTSRRDDPTSSLGHERSAAYRNYKSQLDKLFTGNTAPAAAVDEAALAAKLDSANEQTIEQALDAIADLQANNALKRTATLKARIKTVLTTCDAPKIQSKAKALLAKL